MLLALNVITGEIIGLFVVFECDHCSVSILSDDSSQKTVSAGCDCWSTNCPQFLCFGLESIL